MNPIRFDSRSYHSDDQPVYLNSGEFHYFRVPTRDWKKRMRLFKEAGGNCLATYVPWVVHEPVEGRFVFGTDEHNQLERFLDTAASLDLRVLARPGPYQYSEMMYLGLPHWLSDNYPQALARDFRGNRIRFFSVSYLHPLFLEKAKRWYDAVCPILARHTTDKGGPITFTQVDNELTGIHLWFSGPDYHPDTMGFGRPGGRYPAWLGSKFSSVASMNRDYATSFASFEDAKPTAMNGPATIAETRRRRDYFEFYLGTIAEYATLLASWLRQHGIRTPIVHNAACPEMNTLFQETVKAMGRDFLLGSDHYYTLDQNWGQNNPTPQYARNVFCSCEMLRLMGFPPTVFELPGGSLSDWPPVTAQDARACYLANVAFGMKGHNYYIWTGGPNPPGIGNTTELYDYGAAVGAQGEVRPLYFAQKQFGLLMRKKSWLAAAEREFDVRFAMDQESVRSQYYWRERGDFPLTAWEAWNFMQKGPLSTALCASLSPAFIDPDSDDWLADTATPLVVTAHPAMPAARQQNLVRFIAGGGRVLFTPMLPTHDRDWKECRILCDFLGVPPLKPRGKDPASLTIGKVRGIFCNGESFALETLPEQAEVLGTDAFSPAPLCAAIPKGKGEAIILGITWHHAMREQEQMLRLLLARLGLKQKVLCVNPNVWTSLRTARDKSMLFLMNLMSSPMETSVQCRPSWSKKMLATGHHKLPPMTVKCVELGK